MPCNHKDACSDSRKLCDQLFEALNQKPIGVERKQGGHYCDLWAGRTFAYISHSKRTGHLNIWFLGSEDEAKEFEGLKVKPRSETAGTWNDWGGSFTASDVQQVTQAARLLHRVSYPLPTNAKS